MINRKVLITRIFPENAAEMLKNAGFEITLWNEERPMSQEEMIEKAKSHNALFCTLSDKIDKHFIEKCSHLEIISQFGVGYDNIDIAEATRLKIPVGYTPDVLSDATADIAFGLMIATSRKMFFLHKQIINNQWNYFKPNANLGLELKNKTLGIFGLGRIGFKMAERCKGAYNMKIIYHNRKPNTDAEKALNATYVDFDTLLSQSDVVSVHCALTPETKGIFNINVFRQMKPTSIFINTSRGMVHNEVDLIEALKKGIIWGVGLDVTNPEPMKSDNELLQMENVSVLPHIGSATIETRFKMAEIAARNIIDYYNSKNFKCIVNPEVLNEK